MPPVVMLVLAVLATACQSATSPRPVLVQPGAPGQPSRVVGVDAATDLSHIQFTDADVRFMQAMIGHHAQALDMTALVRDRTESEDLRLLAQRIEVSQADEILLMQTWLADRGQPAPDPHAHHAPGAMLMPGMLTPDEMARLEAARGTAFEKLFLESMIRHHQGALVMVEELFSHDGAAQESDVFGFASDVDTDQRLEIARMAALLGSR